MYFNSIKYLIPIIVCTIMPVKLTLGQDVSTQTLVTQKKPVKAYVGSKKCGKCHEQHYDGWMTTLHTKMEQKVIATGFNQNVLGDFSSKDPDLTFTLDEVDMLVGSRFKQRYAKKIGDDYYMLPAQWNVETDEWVPYNPKKDWWAAEKGLYPTEWHKRPNSKLCEGCHTTGFDIQTKKPAEQNIACEACHGPGHLHAKTEKKVDIVNPAKLSHELGNMICFQCHMRGRPPKGDFETYAWAVGYQPGDDLKKYWVYSQPSGKTQYGLWADGYTRKNRVQGNTFIQSKMYHKGVRCYTCHDPHGTRHTAFTIKSAETNSICLSCHDEKSQSAVFKNDLSEHTHHQATSNGSKCIECHMPKTGKNAIEWDSRDHSFTFISPLSTIRFSTPNGCNNCHTNKTPEWALKEITNWTFLK